MDIILSNSSGKPIYEQIADQVKEQIMTGALAAGEALPSMRLLARDLRISVITTKRAYEELEQAGYLISVTGRGSFAAHPGQKQVRQEQDSRLEGHLRAAATIAREAGINQQELLERLSQCYEEEQ